MHAADVVFLVIAILELLVVASLTAVLLRRLRFPYTIGLMIVGILLAFAQDRLEVLESRRQVRLTPDIVLSKPQIELDRGWKHQGWKEESRQP